MRVLDSGIAYQNPFITVREDTVEYDDGSTAVFGVVVKSNFAVVIPYERQGFWLVRQWRHAVGVDSWEFPAGGWPPSFTGDRGDTQALARAELREETGITAGGLEHLGRLAPNIGLVEQWMDVWLATDLTHGEPDRETSEQGMEHAFFTLDEFRALIARGEFVDVQSLAGFTLLQLRGLP